MNLIAAVDKNWGIGKNGKLLISIREDMEFFKDKTTGNVVVMGRKTLDSLPGGRPLKDRTNIVLTKNKNFEKEGVIVCRSVEELEEKLKEYDPESVFCIGGGAIYKMLLPLCDTAFITKIDYAYDADTYIPNLDEDSEWMVAGESDEMTNFDIAFKFVMYKRI